MVCASRVRCGDRGCEPASGVQSSEFILAPHTAQTDHSRQVARWPYRPQTDSYIQRNARPKPRSLGSNCNKLGERAPRRTRGETDMRQWRSPGMLHPPVKSRSPPKGSTPNLFSKSSLKIVGAALAQTCDSQRRHASLLTCAPIQTRPPRVTSCEYLPQSRYTPLTPP